MQSEEHNEAHEGKTITKTRGCMEKEDILDDIENGEFFDSLSTAYCDVCGCRLTMDEFTEWESFCEECMWEETNGIIDDNTEEEL